VGARRRGTDGARWEGRWWRGRFWVIVLPRAAVEQTALGGKSRRWSIFEEGRETMNWGQFWQDYQVEIIIAVIGAVVGGVVALLGQKVIPGLWGALGKLASRVWAGVGGRRSERVFERRYLAQLCAEHRFLELKGIRTHSPVAVELEDVYVSLTLDCPLRERGKAGEVVVAVLEEGALRERRGTPARPSVPGERPGERLGVGEALRRCAERTVILGGPGTGKTTLLSYLVLKFARGEAKEALGLDEERLPILVPLRELTRKDLTLTAANLPALCTTDDLVEQCPEGFFEKRLKDGKCLVLLDGMDEVTTPEARQWVAEQIEDFVSCYPGNRFVVTSRPAGYGGVALGGFTQLTVCDFDRKEIEAFARQWCGAVEAAVRGARDATSKAVARREAGREAEKLVAAIRASDRVRRLVVNPLLLTIVALVHRYRATLPNRRVELYDECTQVLLGHWDEAKGIAGRLDPARKRRVLEPLAYWMHEEGVREADGGQVEKVIARALPAVGQDGARAAEFLKSIRERSGLLVERGLGVYGFSHLTFQEYLTAGHLINRGEEGRATLLDHLHDPWWLEVTLLYAGMRDATPLIRELLGEREDLFKNDLFLAARCLVDVVDVDSDVVGEVLSRLLEAFRAGAFEGWRDRAGESLAALSSSPAAPRVAESLVGLLVDREADVRGRAVEALDRLGQATPEVVEALVSRLGDEEAGVRGRAAEALGKLRQATPEVVKALLGLLNDEEADVHRRAAFALGKLRQATPAVVEALAGLMGDEEWDVRRRAASALRRLGQATPKVVATMVGLLGDEEAGVRGRAAEALGKLGQATPEIVDALLGQLDDENAGVRRRAASALGKLRRATPEVVEALLNRLGDENAVVRGRAAEALRELGRATPEIVKSLLGRLGDENAVVRWRVASALGQLGQATPEVIRALLNRLGDENAVVRGRVASALGQLGQATPEVIRALLNRLGDEEVDVRGSAAGALGWLGQATPEVIEALVGRRSDEESTVRGRAAEALGRLGRATPEVIRALLNRLGDEEAGVRESAAEALGQLGRATPEVIRALLNQLGDEEAGVRESAAEALGQLGQATPAVVKALLGRLDDRGEGVVNAFYVLRAEPEVVSALLVALEDPENTVRCNAMFALGVGPGLYFGRQKSPAITDQHVLSLKRLLGSDVEVYYSSSGRRKEHRRLRDVAWSLLRLYSEETGKRVYWPEEG